VIRKGVRLGEVGVVGAKREGGIPNKRAPGFDRATPGGDGLSERAVKKRSLRGGIGNSTGKKEK